MSAFFVNAVNLYPYFPANPFPIHSNIELTAPTLNCLSCELFIFKYIHHIIC